MTHTNRALLLLGWPRSDIWTDLLSLCDHRSSLTMTSCCDDSPQTVPEMMLDMENMTVVHCFTSAGPKTLMIDGVIRILGPAQLKVSAHDSHKKSV